MKTNFILTITTGILLFGCSYTDINEEATGENNKPVLIENVADFDNHEEEEIFLNNGSKWEVVPEMLHFIRNMEKGINEFSSKKEESFDAYQKLAILIDENITSLTSNCTMQGQAHDELHKWLLPFISLSEEFDGATEIEEQKRIYNDFKESFEVFNHYFE